jgi:flavin reductase (DIM6/NTAB) family NADH-FMN oxidoreductase RutF
LKDELDTNQIYSSSGKIITSIDKALDKIVAGVSVITTTWENTPYGMTASWYARASNDPYMVSLSVWKKNFTHDMILRSRSFVINVLDDSKKDIALFFGKSSGRDINKFEKIPFELGMKGGPILYEHAIAFIESEVVGTIRAGDHTLFLGQVLQGAVFKDISPKVFARKDFM